MTIPRLAAVLGSGAVLVDRVDDDFLGEPFYVITAYAMGKSYESVFHSDDERLPARLRLWTDHVTEKIKEKIAQVEPCASCGVLTSSTVHLGEHLAYAIHVPLCIECQA